jgi:hypothetical protein
METLHSLSDSEIFYDEPDLAGQRLDEAMSQRKK